MIARLARIPSWRPAAALAVSLALVAVFGCLDYLTGYELSFSIFYLVPVSLAAIAAGGRFRYPVAAAGAAAWLWADLAWGHSYTMPLIPYWNALVRLGYFVLHAGLLTQLVRQRERERQLARVDPLTGAANWRHFEECAAHELERARRSGRPLTVAYVDLDDFKSVNDTLGHAAGDGLLRTIASTAQRELRAGDLLARLGGDEFAVLLPETGRDEARCALDRLQERLLTELAGGATAVTLSLGAVTFTAMPPDVESLLRPADELMYEVKRGGKNRILHRVQGGAGPAAEG